MHLFLASQGSGVAKWPSCALGNAIGDLSQRSFGKEIFGVWGDPKSPKPVHSRIC